MSDLARFEHDDRGVARLTLNRPEARNPTSIAMLDAMDRGLDRLDALDDARVLVLGGAGPAFCAGLDLAEVRAEDAVVRTMLERLSAVMRRLRRLPVVTVARVQGAAIGGGFGFAAVCDFRVTHPEAKLGYPPLATCLSPALMAPWLVRIVGPARARSFLLAGGTVDGAAAHAMGIATHLVERDELNATCASIVERVLAGGAFASRAMKTFLNELDDSLDDPILDRAAAVSAEVILHPESRAQQARTLPPADRGAR